jgi:uncharacterized metal-binding protein
MAQYKSHVKFNLILFLPLFYFLFWKSSYPNSPEKLYFIGSFIYATLFLHPDLDLVHKTSLFSLKGLLTFPWRGYSMIFKHRGISHLPVIGTVTRILWLLAWISVVLFIIGKKTNLLSVLQKYEWEISYIILGLICADIAHLFVDLVTSRRKLR